MVIGGAVAGTAAALAAVLLLQEDAPVATIPPTISQPVEGQPDASPENDPLMLPDMTDGGAPALPAENDEFGDDQAGLDTDTDTDTDADAEAVAGDEASDEANAAGPDRRPEPRNRRSTATPPRTSAANSVRAVTAAPRTGGQGRVRPARVTIYYVGGNDASEDRAHDVARALRLNGWDVDSVANASFPIRTPTARFFNSADAPAANELGAWLQSAMPGDLGSVTPKVVDMTAIAGAGAGEIEILVP